MVWPGLAVLLATLAFNLLGDGLRDAFDPRSSQPLTKPPHQRLKRCERGGTRFQAGLARLAFTERRNMNRRLWLSVAMLATGASLLVATSLASAGTNGSALKKGGIWKVGTVGASVQVDPQLAYITTAWWMEYATAAKLYNYPDKSGPAGSKLVPEVASKFLVSNSGKRYTFFIRKGFKFSDGTAVTPNSFKYAINRTANKKLASPGAPFITDANGTNIVGAADCNNSDSCTNVPGVKVKGQRLIVNLTRADGTFMSKITMPFFQATSTKLPLTSEVVTVNNIRDIPSAGPYAMSRNEADTLTSLRQNPFWKVGPGRHRPRNLDGIDIQWNLNEQTAFNQTRTTSSTRARSRPLKFRASRTSTASTRAASGRSPRTAPATSR